jgi:Immunoglobulin domain
MSARIPRLAKGLAALALLVLLLSSARAQDDSRRKQEILLDELPARVVSDAPFQILAKSTSGLSVAFEVVDGPAVMDGKKVRLTGAPGLVIIRATQKGNLVFAPAAPTERVFAVKAKPFPPSIEIQPSSTSGGVGEQLTLTAAAKGEPTPAYQWLHDGAVVSGATGPSLVIMSLTTQDTGFYQLLATNDLGSVKSTSVQVSVGKRRQSINFPAQPSVVSGQSVSLNATATSGLPVEYKIVSGTAILTANTLTLQQGTVLVEADQAGDSNYEAAVPAMQSFSMMPSSQGARFP